MWEKENLLHIPPNESQFTSCAGASLSTWSAFFFCSTYCFVSLSAVCRVFGCPSSRSVSVVSQVLLPCWCVHKSRVPRGVCVPPTCYVPHSFPHTTTSSSSTTRKDSFWGRPIIAHVRFLLCRETVVADDVFAICSRRSSFRMAFAWMRVIITLSNWHFWLEDGEKRCLFFLTTLSSMGSRMKRVY